MMHPGPALGLLFAGLIIWAARFLAIYTFTALACAKGFAGEAVAGIGIVPAFIGAATIVALTANILVIISGLARVRAQPGPADELEPVPFIGYTGAGIAGLSIVAILWESLPVLVLPVCQ